MVVLATLGDSEVVVSEDTTIEEEEKRLRSAAERRKRLANRGRGRFFSNFSF